MASSTECPLFPKPRKGTGKSATENRKRNENNQNTYPLIIPGLSFAQVLNPNKSQQMAARGNASSASNQNNDNSQTKNNDRNETINKETINAIQNDSNEFGFLQAILEMQKIFTLFPSLLSEMKKSYNYTNPADKLELSAYIKENDRTHPAPGRGGTAILIKNFISHYHVPTPPLFTGVEATLITISPIDYDPILISSIYIPPINNYFQNLGAALDSIFNFNSKTILVGDFKAKHTSWGVHCSDTRGNIDCITIFTENLYLHTASYTIEIESQVRDLTSEILTTHEKASKPVTHSEVAFVQGELKHLFKERNRARKLWQFTRHPQHKTELNRLQNTIKRKANLYRQQVWEDHLTSLDTEDGSLWGTAKAFRRKAAPISALNGPIGTALSDTHKTELIAQSLESQFQLNDIQNPHKDEYITNTVAAYFTANTNNTDQLPPALPSEIISFLKKIKIRKSPGRDVVVPILKPGKDPKLAESHRPISLLPVLSKLAEKIISARLNDYLENKKVLSPEQHGFRPRLSTTHQLLRVVEYIKEGNNKGQCTAAVFLDIQKAFDRSLTFQDRRLESGRTKYSKAPQRTYMAFKTSGRTRI
ncbi:probable RNA-directed DNA polymerase from transposon X-element [Trichonephila clavipes]|nr:probable RNA-directed DNA polymerase from transposon X-element [Trichonephila clavipes]